MKKAKAQADQPQPAKTIRSIGDLQQDARNANRGTTRGAAMIGTSLTELGAGRSVVADKNGVLIIGNKTVVQAAKLGLPIDVVQSDGNRLVVVQRTDLDLATDRKAKRLALADNRTSEVDLVWNNGVLDDLAGDDATLLDDLFTPAEQREIAASAAALEALDADAKYYGTLGAEKFVKIVVAVGDVATVEVALKQTGEVNRGDALLAICQAYIRRGQTR